MKIYKDIIQGTPEWFALRKGKMTGSHGQEIGNCGKGLETYVWTLISEALSTAEKEVYSNEHLERGVELEAQARSIYEMENDVDIEEVGFVEYNEYVGSSPDGLEGGTGIIEIKCHNDMKHLRLILLGENEIESKYLWQMQMNMLVTGREYCRYIAYNPNFEQSLVVFTINKDEDMHKKLKEGFILGEKLICEILEKYDSKKAI